MEGPAAYADTHTWVQISFSPPPLAFVRELEFNTKTRTTMKCHIDRILHGNTTHSVSNYLATNPHALYIHTGTHMST